MAKTFSQIRRSSFSSNGLAMRGTLRNAAGRSPHGDRLQLSDAHINDAIIDAIKQSDLKIFLVDPSGDKILDKRDPRAVIPDYPGPLLGTIPPRIIGMSQRPVVSTFVFAGTHR